MLDADQYELIDFGAGRRLERFAGWTIDRPCPAAEPFQKTAPELWHQADAKFDRVENNSSDDEWTIYSDLPEAWTVRHDRFQLELRPSPVGHLGIFPEQAPNWDWIGQQIAKAAKTTAAKATAPGPLRVLNLFAYTGGSTLAAAAAGVQEGIDIEVVHVDSAANTVARGKRNAELSGLGDAPIRWITEDALKFVRRELKRGNRYDAVILDPPSYGHGRRGEVWRMSKHLPELLAVCADLMVDRCRFVLLTCHTPGFDEKRLIKMLRETIIIPSAQITAGPLEIPSISGGKLPSGTFVRLSTL